MFQSPCVVGAGRVGKAVAARLGEKIPTRSTGRELDIEHADLVVVCVPDRAIPEVAKAIEPGPWIAHTSGASSLAALDPHARRFSIHPLQTFSEDLGPEQLDGSWSAISGESEEALEAGRELAGLLGVTPFVLDDEDRPLYHAAAQFASAFLVTLHDVAAELMEAVDAPPQALEPLMRRTIENGFQHTGPLVRGDWETVEGHLDAIGAQRPDLLPLYRALADMEAALLGARTR
jgi:predicted short-subunit dehydrogenase-like oxidoreductase (DUF2520 family)